MLENLPKPPNALLLKADGQQVIIQSENLSDFTLEELYKHLSCTTVEIARSQAAAQQGRRYKDYILIIDEEGKLKNNRINNVASEWYSSPVDQIVGDAIICHDSMFK